MTTERDDVFRTVRHRHRHHLMPVAPAVKRLIRLPEAYRGVDRQT
jgi:hypothetical protein